MAQAMKAAAAAGALALGLILTATGIAQAGTRHATSGSVTAGATVERASADISTQQRERTRTGDGRSGGRNHQQRPPHQGRICAGCAG